MSMQNDNELTRQPQSGAGESEEATQGQEMSTEQASQVAPGASGEELPADLAAAYGELRREKNALYDRLLRKQAELENFRKRMKREKDELLQHAAADLVRALLPTLDAFERALQHRDTSTPEHFYQGIKLIYRELLEVLKRAGLTPLETVGNTFDPHVHQAVETVESKEHRDHEVVEELQRGYKLKQRLLRPAIVKVAVAPGKERAAVPSGPSAHPADSE